MMIPLVTYIVFHTPHTCTLTLVQYSQGCGHLKVSHLEHSTYVKLSAQDECYHKSFLEVCKIQSCIVDFIEYNHLCAGLKVDEVAHDYQVQVKKYVCDELHLRNSFDTWHG